MVATIAAGTTAGYYLAQSEYYLGGGEPPGAWIAGEDGFGIIVGKCVERELFERLHAGTDAAGKTLLTNGGNRLDRVPGYDITFSAPKSVSVLWALGGEALRERIENAQSSAVAAAIGLVDRYAAVSRRGRNGLSSEAVSLNVAAFQHGEARPTEHADGRIFADPQLHTHAVVLNLAHRADATVGTLDGRRLFAWKMAAGAAYHLALASSLQQLGLEITDLGKNGTFEIAGVDPELSAYFSARRAEMEGMLDEEGLNSASAPALAAAIAKASRTSKETVSGADRFAAWQSIADDLGYEGDRLLKQAMPSNPRALTNDDEIRTESDVRARISAIPETLTMSQSVFERRHLMAAVASTLVGTGASLKRAEDEVRALIEKGRVVELGADAIGEMRYSTPQMIAIERGILNMAQRLSARSMAAPDPALVEQLVRTNGLSSEQVKAVRTATAAASIVVIEGAAGSGKTTTLGPIVEAHRAAGYRILGSATAWRIAHQLRDDLGIDARATDSWLAGSRVGRPFLDAQTLLVVDEAGQLSSRQMHAVLTEVQQAGAKLVLVGDRRQLQPIGAGGALSIVARPVNLSRVDTIVRQKAQWARAATMELAAGKTYEALLAYADRGQIHFHDGVRSAIHAMVDAWQQTLARHGAQNLLLLARTNAQIRAINLEVRRRLREAGALRGLDIAVDAVTSSGHAHHLELAVGDEIRFLVRHDGLGVINGTTGIVTKIVGWEGDLPRIVTRVGDRDVTFTPSDLADENGKARIGHAYASTIYGAQGLTADHAFVLLDPTCNRHDAYVGLSRARDTTEIFADTKPIDVAIRAELALSERSKAVQPDPDDRIAWLGRALSRYGIKGTTLDILPAEQFLDQTLMHSSRTRDAVHQVEL